MSHRQTSRGRRHATQTNSEADAQIEKSSLESVSIIRQLLESSLASVCLFYDSLAPSITTMIVGGEKEGGHAFNPSDPLCQEALRRVSLAALLQRNWLQGALVPRSDHCPSIIIDRLLEIAEAWRLSRSVISLRCVPTPSIRR